MTQSSKLRNALLRSTFTVITPESKEEPSQNTARRYFNILRELCGTGESLFPLDDERLLWATITWNWDNRGECFGETMLNEFPWSQAKALQTNKDLEAVTIMGANEKLRDVVESAPNRPWPAAEYRLAIEREVNRLRYEQLYSSLRTIKLEPEDVDGYLRRITDVFVDVAGKGVWRTPQPITMPAVLPQFPLAMLPPVLRSVCTTLARHIQIDPGMVFSSALVTLATAAQRGFNVESAGTIEPLVLQILLCAPPGGRKSAAVKATTLQQLSHWVEQNIEAAKSKITEHKLKLRIKEKKSLALENELVKSGSDDYSELIALQKEIEELKATCPVEPRLIAQNCTNEKLIQLLQEQLECMAVIDTEGNGPINRMLGQYSGGNIDVEVYLKGACADLLYVDRMSRESNCIEAPRLSYLMCLQPILLMLIAKQPMLRGLGIIARAIWITPEDHYGRQLTTTQIPLDPEVMSVWQLTFDRLMQHSQKKYQECQLIRLSPAAKQLLNQHNDIEIQGRAAVEDIDIRDWSSKATGHTARMAGLLHCSLHPNDPSTIEISEATMQCAITLYEYYRRHTKFMVGERMDPSGNKALMAASVMVEWLQTHKRQRATRTELYEAARKAGKILRSEEANEPITILIDRGYLKELTAEVSSKGRTSAPKYEVNPQIQKASARIEDPEKQVSSYVPMEYSIPSWPEPEVIVMNVEPEVVNHLPNPKVIVKEQTAEEMIASSEANQKQLDEYLSQT